MEFKEIPRERFVNSKRMGQKSVWDEVFMKDLTQMLLNYKGKCVELPILENLKFYTGKTKNPSKALNVMIRTLVDNPNKKVKIDRIANAIRINLE